MCIFRTSLGCEKNSSQAFMPIFKGLKIKSSYSVRLKQLIVPSHKFRGDDASLICQFDMENEALYSVKMANKSDQNRVFLKNLDLSSAGSFRCEVSAEAPLFNTVSSSRKLNIVALPRSGPRISGGQRTYHVDDRVQPAKNNFLRHYSPILHEDGLETAILGLDFIVRRRSFRASELTLTLRCSSSISTINSELKAMETHHQKSSIHFSYGSLFPSGCSRRNGKESTSFLIFSIIFVVTL
ncbi:unnamed protein product [Lepeophtheirus salmonis]|uniref:(salmon louse) hypothetical protein n=1 Tax=Lepeophtheirus salmonis TaxID=72036 RepID=A0A7R8H1R6_LEPSM|nr:unnamed protein product [Lepeophtheirus salmonis]CAF2798638.1 unnamed protein product [Lepeophtheirus salmonis]